MAKLDAIGIVTQDMAAALRFYGLLGVAVPTDQAHEQHVEATLESGVRLMWDTQEFVKTMDSGWVKPVGQRSSLAFLCESPADVDATYASVIAAGFEGHKAPWDAFWGQRYAVVTDPDGNHVDLFAAL